MGSARMELELDVADAHRVEEEGFHHLRILSLKTAQNWSRSAPRSSKGQGRDGWGCSLEGTQDHRPS